MTGPVLHYPTSVDQTNNRQQVEACIFRARYSTSADHNCRTTNRQPLEHSLLSYTNLSAPTKTLTLPTANLFLGLMT